MSERLFLEIPGRAPAELPRRGRMVIGSDPERADLVLDGQGVAGVHCAVGRLKGGGWALQDLGSEFGTLHNQQPVTTARLEAGDVVVIGSRRLRVVDPSAESRAQAPPPIPVEPAAAGGGTGPAPDPAPTTPPRTLDASPRDERERPEIPGFKVEGLLGKGGAGTVWLAEQESLARRVALKVLNARLARDASFVERFQAEARAAASLNHPNVVHVYDVGESDGQHYLVMEYMSGGCLESALTERGPLPWREALRALADIARALVYAESRGLVHRDIKPANLMRGEHGTTKLADLGLASQVEQASLEQTVERKVLGTPHFIAPEVIRGAPASPRSDLFSLGATAHRLLSGRTPFQGERTADILRSVLNDTPQPLDELVLGLPAEVARFVERLLDKDPERRPPSAGVALAELERLIEGRAATGPEGITVGGSRRAPLWVLLLLVAALVGFLVLRGGAGDSGGGTSGSAGGDPRGADPTAPGPGPAGEGDATARDSGSDPVGPATVVGGPDPARPSTGDGEAAERAFEERAALALVRLGEEQLADADRVARLRELAAEFPGSTAAASALEQARQLESAVGTEQALAEELQAARDAFLARAREAAGLGAAEPRPGDGLRALDALPDRADWSQDPQVTQALADLREEVLEEGRARADAVERRARELEQAGDAGGLESLLRGYLACLDFPAFEAGVPPQVQRMRQVGDQARETLAGLDELRTRFAREAAREGRVGRARALGGREGLEAELRRTDLDAALARLDGLLSADPVAEVAAPLLVLRAELERAREARDALTEGWTSPGWRRRTLLDPRGSRATPVECVGFDARGPLVGGAAGPEVLGWGAYAADARCLGHLFLERLERDWSPTEREGVAALVRQAAVLAALDLANQMLETGSTARFTPSEAETLLAPFAEAEAWSDPGAARAALDRERAAAEVLVRALRALSERAWGDAAVHLERLTSEHEGSLLVLLLSDGGA